MKQATLHCNDKTTNHSAERYMRKPIIIIILELNNETPSRATINNKHQASSKIRRRIIAKEKKKKKKLYTNYNNETPSFLDHFHRLGTVLLLLGQEIW